MLAYCSSLSTRAGTILSALIVVFCIIGLTMHRDFYARKIRKDFFCFYTNLSNLVVLIYFSAAGPKLYAYTGAHPWIAHTEFAVMMSIMLTFLVFHLALYPAIRTAVENMPRTREYRIVCTDNFLIHYLVPLMVFAYWLFCSPNKDSLRIGDAIYWTVLPLGYTLYIFLRAPIKGEIKEAGSPYPYPFLDVRVLGIKHVLRICTSLYAVSVLAGLSIVWLVHAL